MRILASTSVGGCHHRNNDVNVAKSASWRRTAPLNSGSDESSISLHRHQWHGIKREDKARNIFSWPQKNHQASAENEHRQIEIDRHR